MARPAGQSSQRQGQVGAQITNHLQHVCVNVLIHAGGLVLVLVFVMTGPELNP